MVGKHVASLKGGLLSRQPFQYVFSILTIFESFFIQLPIRLALYITVPSLKPNPKWPLGRSLFVSILKVNGSRSYPLFSRSSYFDKTVLPKFSSSSDATAIWIQPIEAAKDLYGDLKDYFDAGACTTPKVLAYWYGEDYKGQNCRIAKKGESVYLYFHGGGYWERSAQPSDPTVNCLRILLKVSNKSGNVSAPKRGLAVEYRLTDQSTFPRILADAIAAWKYLIEQGFEAKNIVIAGDSAGGNLALALTRYLCEHHPYRASQNPNGLILLSPWVDVSLSYYDAGPSSSGNRNAATDFLIPWKFKRAWDFIVQGLPSDALTSRWMSSLCKKRKVEENLFEGFPRLLLFGGTLEGLVDEIRALNDKYSEAAKLGKCGQVTYIEEPFATHDWCALPIGFGPEQKRTLGHVADWI